MTVNIEIPDAVCNSLRSAGADIGRTVIEGFAADAYRSGALSCAEVRVVLGHGSRWETESFLANHQAWPAPTEEEVAADLVTLAAGRGK